MRCSTERQKSQRCTSMRRTRCGGSVRRRRGYIFSNLSNDRVADTILRELQFARPDGYNRREFIHDVFGRNVDAYAISCALRTLEAAGKIRCEKNKPNGRGPGGRPGEKWFAV